MSSPFPRRFHRVALTPVPLVSRVQGRGGAAGPGKGRAQGGVLKGQERGSWAQSGELTGQVLHPSISASISWRSHGPPHGKRPSAPLPSPILVSFLAVIKTTD